MAQLRGSIPSAFRLTAYMLAALRLKLEDHPSSSKDSLPGGWPTFRGGIHTRSITRPCPAALESCVLVRKGERRRILERCFESRTAHVGQRIRHHASEYEDHQRSPELVPRVPEGRGLGSAGRRTPKCWPFGRRLTAAVRWMTWSVRERGRCCKRPWRVKCRRSWIEHAHEGGRPGPAAGGAERVVAGAGDSHRGRSAGDRAAAGARQHAGACRESPLQFVDLAGLSAEVEVDRGTDSLAVPQRDFDGRFLGSLAGAGRSGGEGTQRERDRAAEGTVVAGVRSVDEARSLREAVRLRLGRRHSCNIRLEDEANSKQCLLVLMGATADGQKELIAVLDGYRESEQSWRNCSWTSSSEA